VEEAPAKKAAGAIFYFAGLGNEALFDALPLNAGGSFAPGDESIFKGITAAS